MDRLSKYLPILIIISLSGINCFNSNNYKEEKQFYTAYAGRDYVYTIEAEFLNENTFFSIYTKDRKKIFETVIHVAPVIDSVIDKKIFLLKHLQVKEEDKKPVDFICKTDTLDINFEGFKLITKYTCANNEGRNEVKKWKFIKLDNNTAYFLDINKMKNIKVPTSQITNIFQTLNLRNAEGYSDITYSKDTSDVKKYFDAFFTK